MVSYFCYLHARLFINLSICKMIMFHVDIMVHACTGQWMGRGCHHRKQFTSLTKPINTRVIINSQNQKIDIYMQINIVCLTIHVCFSSSVTFTSLQIESTHLSRQKLTRYSSYNINEKCVILQLNVNIKISYIFSWSKPNSIQLQHIKRVYFVRYYVNWVTVE